MDSESVKILARTIQHRGFVRLRNGDEAGTDDVFDAEQELARSHAPFGEANDCIHLSHYYMDAGAVSRAEDYLFRLEPILGPLNFALVQVGDIKQLGSLLGIRMSAGVIFAMARLRELQGRVAEAEGLYESFNAACQHHGIQNQGAIRPKGSVLVPGTESRFVPVPRTQLDWLDQKAEEGWRHLHEG